MPALSHKPGGAAHPTRVLWGTAPAPRRTPASEYLPRPWGSVNCCPLQSAGNGEQDMAASVWSGYLTFGLISMPVRLFSGARSSGISFNMLHRPDKSRLKQQYVCLADGQVVDRSEIVKGYEFRKDEYIVIEPEEIKKIEPQTAKTMEILEFVKKSEVDPVYFESSYYMMPEEAGRRPYALLTKALEESEFVAIAKLTMHNREYTVFLRPHEGGLMLHTMYYEEEVKKVEGFGAPDVELKSAEVKVAHQLIEALADKWDPEKY